MVSKGQVVGMTGTASHGYTAMYLAHMTITGGRGFKSHLGLGFLRVYVSPRIYIIYHVVVVVSITYCYLTVAKVFNIMLIK